MKTEAGVTGIDAIRQDTWVYVPRTFWRPWMAAIKREGMTLVPLMVYFNSKGRAKVELALAKGKKAHDKRDSIKERDWKREQGRLMRDRG